MKKFVGLLLLVGLVATPALAERTPIQLDASQIEITPYLGTLPSSRDLTHLYDNQTAAAGWLGMGAGVEIGDDLQMIGPSITHIHFVYADTSTNTAPITGGSLWFYGDSTTTPGFTVGTTIAGFGLPALPAGGGWNIKLTLPTVTASNSNIWMGLVMGRAVDYLVGGPPSIGTTVPNSFYTGFPPSYVTGIPDLYYAVGGVPEPAAIALLATGGLLVLRRRR